MTTASQAMKGNDVHTSQRHMLRKTLGSFFARLRNAFRAQVIAEGYEDEEGFHFGKRPHPNCTNLERYSREMQERKNFETTVTASANGSKPVSVTLTPVAAQRQKK